MEELSSGEDLRRETAVARLAVIGARAVTSCPRWLSKTPRVQARLAAIQALGDR
jgi:hypothetical protein